jgi:HTH-type transcriptional regulator / antitoxin HigA
MARKLGNEYSPDLVSQPGETLLEILEERGMTQVAFAVRTGRTPKLINEIVKGKAPITTETALQFERVLGVPASFWNNRERAYREYLALEAERESLSQMLEWSRRFPLSSMTKLGWIRKSGNKVAQLRALLDFFGVATPDAWESTWDQTVVSYRKTGTNATDKYALATWLRVGELVGRKIPCEPHNPLKFREALARARELTIKAPGEFQHMIVEEFSKCGVAIAFVPALPRISASGATRWLSPKKALIQINLRYKTDDHFWFTLFHEAGHVLFDSKKMVFVDTRKFEGEFEEKANHFAGDFLIPLKTLHRFAAQYSDEERVPSRRSISRFASELEISPGIVVGQLQHAGVLPYSHCNDLKRSFSWDNDEVSG